MIVFKQLNITHDSKYLIIDAAIEDSEYFDKVYIHKVCIDNQDTYSSTNRPSDKVKWEHEFGDNDELYNITKCCSSTIKSKGTPKVKHIRIQLSTKDLINYGINLDKDMLFVYIIAEGYPSPDCPCGYDNSITLGVVANLYPYYLRTMNNIRELGDTCTIPKGFINDILQFKAIELSIKTGNYLQAINYWKKFFNNSIVRTYKCNCNG